MTGGGPTAGNGPTYEVLARGGGGGGGDGSDESDLVQHLLADAAIKGVIVIVALIVLVLGMVLIWKKAGRAPHRDDR
ncbi:MULTISPECIES: hypothetical protein [Streptomyces]|uniref:hypothetical protein n=1 Tax=Streptomyces TaxID=1883 RepID=UPI00202268BE|nr:MULTISPECIES: hypothetical protein [Streptomyces]MCL7495163.1 hypothetical protein [Streptomyces sp. MCA2]